MAPQSSSVQLAVPAVQYRKPVRGSLVWWLRFLGVVAFIIILLRLPSSRGVHMFQIDARWIGFAMLLTVLQLVLETVVWQGLLSIQQIRHPYPRTLLAYLASQYLGLVTPGHVGEFLAAGYVSTETGITVGYALSSVVGKKLLAWTVIVGFGVWGLPLLAQMPVGQGVQRIVLTSVVVLVALSAGIGLWVVSLRRLTKKWRKLSPLQVDMTELWAGLRHLCSLKLVAPLGAAALAFSLLFFQLDAILRALGIVLPFVLVARIIALSRILARLVPVSIVGFGSKDAAVIWLLAQQGIDPAVGFTVTLLFLMCSYLISLVLSGLCWWIKPLVIRRVAPTSS